VCSALTSTAQRVIHPVVRVSFVDLTSGKYIQKVSKNVVAPFEHVYADSKHVLPVMTQPSELRATGGLLPTWNEVCMRLSFDVCD